MKKTSYLLIFIILIITFLFFVDSTKGRLLLLNLYSKDLSFLHKTTLSFMEDIRFKDFVAAANYHSKEDREKVNIPKLIESKFHIKPEFLDVMEYKILDSSIDSTKMRARVKVKSKVNILNSNEIRQPELIFYYHKKNNIWYMELESSL